MRFVRTLLLTIVTVGLLAAVAVGSGWAVRHYAGDDPSAVRATGVPAAQPSTPSTSSPSPSTAAEPSADPAPSPSATPSPTPPPPVLKPGEKGEPVRELQHRLFQLAWWGELTTGAYDAETTSVEVHDEPRPGDHDLLDLAAAQALLNGGTVVVAPPGKLDVDAFATVMAEQRVTALCLSAGLFTVLADTFNRRFEGLAMLLSGSGRNLFLLSWCVALWALSIAGCARR